MAFCWLLNGGLNEKRRYKISKNNNNYWEVVNERERQNGRSKKPNQQGRRFWPLLVDTTRGAIKA